MSYAAARRSTQGRACFDVLPRAKAVGVDGIARIGRAKVSHTQVGTIPVGFSGVLHLPPFVRSQVQRIVGEKRREREESQLVFRQYVETLFRAFTN